MHVTSLIWLLISIQTVCNAWEQPDFPTYPHPIDGISNKCYRCPPGYRINSENTEWDKCEISKKYQNTWPECLACPEGYYSAEWSKDSFCIPQVRCDGKHELTEFAGTTSQRGLCVCETGYTRVHGECKAVLKDVALAPTCPPPVQCPQCAPCAQCAECPKCPKGNVVETPCEDKGTDFEISSKCPEQKGISKTTFLLTTNILIGIICILILYILVMRRALCFKKAQKPLANEKIQRDNKQDYEEKENNHNIEKFKIKNEQGAFTSIQPQEDGLCYERSIIGQPEVIISQPEVIIRQPVDTDTYLEPIKLKDNKEDKEETTNQFHYEELDHSLDEKAEPIIVEPQQVSDEAEPSTNVSAAATPREPPHALQREPSLPRYSPPSPPCAPPRLPRGHPHSRGQGLYHGRSVTTGDQRPLSSFEKASMIVELEVVSEADQIRFMRHCLKLSSRDIDSLEGANRNSRVRKAIAKWKQKNPSYDVQNLINACEDLHFNEIAERIRDEILNVNQPRT